MPIPYKKQHVKPDGRKLNRSGPRDMQIRATSSTGADSELVSILTNQLTEIKAEMLAMKSRSGDPAPAGFFSAEQVDEEIRRAVEQAVSEAAISFKGSSGSNDVPALVLEYKEQILELQKGNDNLTVLHAAMAKEKTNLKEEMEQVKGELNDMMELRQQIAVLEQELVGKEEVIATLKSRPTVVTEGDIVTDPDRPQMEQVFVDPLEEGAGEGLKSTINIETITKDDAVNDKVDKLRDLLGKKLPNI